MKPICIPCERFMRAKRNGYYFIEGMPTSEWDTEVGKGAKGWVPYKLWVGDLYECPTCCAQAIAGVSSRPVSEHFEPKFHNLVTHLNARQLIVKDC